jgi:hypothetical protein
MLHFFYAQYYAHPCIETFRPVATSPKEIPCKRLIPRNVSQSLAIPMPTAKLLILLKITIRNQQVAGSIPAGGSMFSSNYDLRNAFR